MAVRKHENHDLLDDITHFHLPEKRIWFFKIKDWHTRIALPALIVITLVVTSLLIRDAFFTTNRVGPNEIANSTNSPRSFTDSQTPRGNQMISLEKIESFSSFAKMLNRNSNFVNSASIVYSLEGQLVEIAKEETEARAYTLTIKSGEKEFDYFVSEKEAEKISVIFVNENRRSGTITNLSEGDLVTINTTVDLLAKESESKVIIAID